MKCALFLYTVGDAEKAEKLKDYLQTKLRVVAEMKNITDVLAEEQELRVELTKSGIVILISSQEASSLIQNNGREMEDGFVKFDGGLIRQEFTANRELVNRLIIVYFTQENDNDWIPAGFRRERIFHIPEEIHCDSNQPVLDKLQDCIKGILLPMAN